MRSESTERRVKAERSQSLERGMPGGGEGERNLHVVGGREISDSLALRDTSCVRDIGLNDVDGSSLKVGPERREIGREVSSRSTRREREMGRGSPEVLSSVHSLSESDGNSSLSSEGRDLVDVSVQKRFLDEERSMRSKEESELLGPGVENKRRRSV